MLAELPQLFFVSAYLLFMLSTIEREKQGREGEKKKRDTAGNCWLTGIDTARHPSCNLAVHNHKHTMLKST